jgi:hypothetical protein
MDWLIRTAEEYRRRIRSGPFFAQLASTVDRAQLGWVNQLVHQSREFTSALCMRYSLCRDPRYQSVFAEHAFEETDHPDQLLEWMEWWGFGGASPETATLETVNNLAYCWRSALRDPPDEQVIALNLMSEGVALDFYTAAIPILEKLGMLTGRYWTVHKRVDSVHLRMGLDRIPPVEPDSEKGQRYRHVLWESATLYDAMLGSWAGRSATAAIASHAP